MPSWFQTGLANSVMTFASEVGLALGPSGKDPALGRSWVSWRTPPCEQLKAVGVGWARGRRGHGVALLSGPASPSPRGAP